MNFTGHEIAQATQGTLLRDGPAGEVRTDSRSLAGGSWFVALVGDRFDGHDFLPTAAGKGCAGAVVQRVPEAWERGLVQVPDTTRALQDLGRAARERLRCPVVGLTGSAGKTTTRAMVALALSPLGTVHQSEGNLNNHLGVPMTLLAATGDPSALVVEMGTSSPGEIALLADIARPDVRLVVNVGPSHLQELGGLGGVAREKGALFETARPGDTLCVNVDDPWVREMPRPRGTSVLGYGRGDDAAIRLVDVAVDGERLATVARVATPAGEVRVEIPAPGAHLAANATAAIAVAWVLGVHPADAAAALRDYAPVGMRLRPEPLPGGAIALNDAYNANPTSMAASLAVLAAVPGRKVAVLGDMLELGGDEARWHDEVGRLAGSLGLDLVVLVGPRMSRAACEGEVWRAEDGLAVVDRLGDWLRPGDRVLFKGSRGARVERVLHALKERG